MIACVRAPIVQCVVPQTLSEIRGLLASRGLSPRHALGQNFLIDHNLLRRLVDESGVGAGDLVLEVGPGTGTLTEELLARGCEVIACELDRGLAGLLRNRLGNEARFTLVEGDCLEGKRALSGALAGALAGRPFTLVANLPYGSATPLMLTLLVDHPECRAMFATIQREVADRLAARPGSKAYGPLAVVASLLARVRTVAALAPECFWPRPEVTSAMVAIERTPTLRRWTRVPWPTSAKGCLPSDASRSARFSDATSPGRRASGPRTGQRACLPRRCWRCSAQRLCGTARTV